MISYQQCVHTSAVKLSMAKDMQQCCCTFVINVVLYTAQITQVCVCKASLLE